MKKFLIFGIYFVNLIIILYFWFLRSGALINTGPANTMMALGRLTGLLAVYLILWQLVLIGRIKIIEKSFGFDRLTNIHHLNGLLAWAFIFLHPVFIILAYKLNNNISFFKQTLNLVLNWEGMLPALFSVLIFSFIIIVSLAAIKKKVKYEYWYLVHLFTYWAISLAFEHQLEYGYTLQDNIFYIYWQAMYVIVIGLLVYYRLLCPIYNFFKHDFRVEKIEKENDNIASIYITGKNLKNFNFLPGQFAIFRFLEGWLSLEAHPFSFSQIKNDKNIRISIKNLGDFSKNIDQKIKIGTRVVIDGPHGTFTSEKTKNNKIAMIAGGIGITPIRSLVEEMQYKDCVVLYATSKEEDIVFKKEFINFNEPVNIKYIVSNPIEGWFGEKGRVDEEKIKRLIFDYLDRSFYICGPPQFRKRIIKTLRKLGVSKRKIYFEKFNF